MLLQTLALCVLGGWLITTLLRDIVPRQAAPTWLTPRVLALASLPVIVLLHVVQAKRFASFGYANDYRSMGVLLLASLVVLAALWRTNRFAALLGSALVLKLYPILHYPITAKRSDMLPIIDEAIRAFLNGENVYRFYLLDNGVQTPNVRFPGLIAAYVPAHLLGLDPRFTLLVCEAVFFLLVYRRWGARPLFLPGFALLAFFPYWHYRHELYEAPFWVALLLLVIAVADDAHFALRALLLGIVVCFHQWGVLLAPLVLVYAMRKTSVVEAASLAVIASVLGLSVVHLFCRGAWEAFTFHTFRYYSDMLAGFVANDSFHDASMSFTRWIGKLGGAAGVQLANVGGQVLVIAGAWFRLGSLTRLFGFMALSLLCLLMTNAVAWTYQYLLIGVLTWLGWLAHEPPASRHVEVPATSGN